MRWKRAKAEHALENSEPFVKITQLDVDNFAWAVEHPGRPNLWMWGERGQATTLTQAQKAGRTALLQDRERQAVAGRVWILKLEEDNA